MSHGPLGGTLDRRTSGIAEAEQAAHLVERLARGVVDGRAEQPVGDVIGHLGQERVTTAHDQGHEREDGFAPRRLVLARVQQPGGVHVALEVVDRDQRQVMDPGQCLGEVDADEQRSGQPRAVRDGDPVHVRPGDTGVGPGLVQDRDDPAQMRPRRDLGDDPARRRMQCDLGGDDIGQDPAAALDQRDARLVARRLDGQQQRPAHVPSSSGSVGAGVASSAPRRRAMRSRIRGSANRSVVMMSASSWSSL